MADVKHIQKHEELRKAVARLERQVKELQEAGAKKTEKQHG